MIVITGATGTVGRPLVHALAAQGVDLTAVARKPAELPSDVRQVLADLADPTSLAPALTGADTLFLLLTGDLLVDAGDPETLVDVITAAGVRRVVFLSSIGTLTRANAPSHARLRTYEDTIRRTSLDWTFLRPGGFASNTLAWTHSIRSARVVAAPFGDVAIPVVDPADLSAVAATVLTQPGHTGRAYVLTGPALISPRTQASTLATALREPIRFVEQTRDEAKAAMLQFIPEPVAEGTLDALGNPLDEELRISPDVETILGRPASPYAAWAKRNIAAFH